MMLVENSRRWYIQVLLSRTKRETEEEEQEAKEERGEDTESESKMHFVLVHGACHGAWCWYKVTALLRAAGHQVTVPDMIACGVNPKQAREVNSLLDYSQPLMEILASLQPEQKVILVGHSFGGLSLGLAMENFPEKISAAVFVTAFMPNLASPFSCFSEEKFLKWNPMESMMDSSFSWDQGLEKLPTSMVLGPKYLLSKFYQCCPPEEYTLATMLVREGPVLYDDLSRSRISGEKFGSVSRVYILCKEDMLINEDFQRWMIENNPVKEVKEIEGADHMAMLSKPQELCFNLLEIAKAYP